MVISPFLVCYLSVFYSLLFDIIFQLSYNLSTGPARPSNYERMLKYMSETMHVLTLEILKAKYDFKSLSNIEIHKNYRDIYAELLQAEWDYVQANPGKKLLK